MVLDGKKVSEELRHNIKNEIKENGYKPSFVVLEVGDNESNKVYVKAKEKACKEVGIAFHHYKYPSDVKEETIINKIDELNDDNEVDGIILQLPISDHLDKDKLLNRIDPLKDVDGLNKNNSNIIPCTVLGILEILKYYNISFEKKHVVIMGKSILVGIPLYDMLKNKDINVDIVDKFTPNIKDITKKADILVVAIGKKHLIDKSYVKDGVIIIDVGITKENGKIYGDVNPEVYSIASNYTPVPGGVGVMNVTSILNNVMLCYKNRRNNEINN